MKDIAIGTAVLEYSRRGTLVRATFNPAPKVDIKGPLLEQLSTIKNNQQEDRIQKQAELILGSWWGQKSHIELAERSEFEVKSRFTECLRFKKGGKVSKCSIEFTLEMIKKSN